MCVFEGLRNVILRLLRFFAGNICLEVRFKFSLSSSVLIFNRPFSIVH